MSVRQARHHHDLLRAGCVGGRRAAGGRHPGQAARPAPRPRAAPPAVGPGRWPGHRHRAGGQGDPADADPARRDPGPPHGPGIGQRSTRTPTATSCCPRTRRANTASSTRSSRPARWPTRPVRSPGPAERQHGRHRGIDDVAKFGDGGELLKCSFCGKSQKQVKKLIAGPGRVHLRRVHRPVQRDHRGGAVGDVGAALRRAAQAP